jgi:hypothetical protein
MFRNLKAVTDAVASAVPGAGVQVKLMDGRLLDVTLVNSGLGELPTDRREAKAREVAGVAYRAYPSRSSLEAVSVTFAINVRAAVINYSNTTDTFRVSVKELETELPTPAASPVSRGVS